MKREDTYPVLNTRTPTLRSSNRTNTTQVRPSVNCSKLQVSPPKRMRMTKVEKVLTPMMEIKQCQPKEFIQFGEVVVGQKVSKNLWLLNPSPESQGVAITKFLKPEKGFSVTSDAMQFESMEKRSVEFSWVPPASGSFFDSVLFQSTDGHTFQVSLTGVGVIRAPPKKAKAGPYRARSLTTTVSKIKKV
ncbi:hypothetical protein HDE_01536 [Halotydeus destructor]|nr:hypothetical protein HDE_01536 [Halotydeus destructor]